jgi:hypothetical protein
VYIVSNVEYVNSDMNKHIHYMIWSEKSYALLGMTMNACNVGGANTHSC